MAFFVYGAAASADGGVRDAYFGSVSDGDSAAFAGDDFARFGAGVSGVRDADVVY